MYFVVNRKINSFVPLPGGVQGWVHKKDIYFLIYRMITCNYCSTLNNFVFNLEPKTNHKLKKTKEAP